jgi:hypothetical protein
VPDEIVDRYCLVAGANALARLRLREAGVTQSNVYLMSGEEENTLRWADATSSPPQIGAVLSRWKKR